MEIDLAEKRQEKCAAPLAERFSFMSSYRSFNTEGCFLRLDCPAADGTSLSGKFQTMLRQAFSQAIQAGIEDPLVVGAIPFDTRKPSALFIPESWQPFSRVRYLKEAPTPRAVTSPRTISQQAIPDKQTFMSMVARATRVTAQPGLDKVVLSRLIDITTENALDVNALYHQLVRQNPASYNFHVPLAGGDSLIGASPELLLRKEGRHFMSLPLAGSVGRESDPESDRLAGESLLHSHKDRHEHELVTQAMRTVLQPWCSRVVIPNVPQLVTTPTLWHLATPIEGDVFNEQDSALSLACLLHPTPALSGFPHEAAKKLIAELEPFNRELFGGIVGWCDAWGNGEWVVTIRSAHISGKKVRCFAGAGIVPASSPESEWNETGMKLSTMLNVFGLN